MRQLARFVAVGCLAASVHWAVVVGAVELLHTAPVRANPFGWLVAYGVSLVGHRGLTFADRQVPWLRAARRHFVVSAAGFAINQAAFVLLLGLGPWGYRVALATVLATVAAGTYLIGRRWAFAAT